MQTPFGIYLWGLVSLRTATAVTIPALSTAGEVLDVQISHRGSVLQLCYLCSSGFADNCHVCHFLSCFYISNSLSRTASIQLL